MEQDAYFLGIYCLFFVSLFLSLLCLSLFFTAIFLLARRLYNDKFSVLKKDFRCLRGTFCAALSLRLLFASLILFLFPTCFPHSPLSYLLSLLHSLSYLSYLSFFLACSLSSFLAYRSRSCDSPLLPCKFTMPSVVISGCALRSRL